MALPLYLALTAAEFQICSSFPQRAAWMACHYSPYASGLSNMPQNLPPDSMLILNDRTPPCGHDAALIAEQLKECVDFLQCSSVLLDFQRPDFEENAAVAKSVIANLTCPVGVSQLYAGGLDCPVFLPPVPLTVPVENCLSPWQNREIWLEAAQNRETITVTEQGTISRPASFPDETEQAFFDKVLRCHYKSVPEAAQVRFTLWRTQDDLSQLLAEAETLGATKAIGLWQELDGCI